MELGVSVIVCCYNSAKRLPATLKHLAFQVVEKNILWEIILVDNASDDHTAKVAKEEWGKYDFVNIDFKIFMEEKKGKIHALQRGIKEARFEFLLTCDDDNWLSERYIATAFQIMEADHSIGVLGGLGLIEAEQPALLKQEELNQLTVHGPQVWAQTDHWIYGAGSILRKSLQINLMNNCWPQITTGRKGSKLISGEDVEICFMIYLLGYKIVADDKLTFKHFVPFNKQKIEYITKMAYWLSYSYFLLSGYLVIINDEKKSINKITCRLLTVHLKALLRQFVKLFYQKLIYGKNTTLDQKKEILANLGMIRSFFENRKKVIEQSKDLRKFLENHPALKFHDITNKQQSRGI
jgi:glycosyltransferase involved in cell wall biosynthesis